MLIVPGHADSADGAAGALQPTSTPCDLTDLAHGCGSCGGLLRSLLLLLAGARLARMQPWLIGRMCAAAVVGLRVQLQSLAGARLVYSNPY